ncbi:hypothetical protein AB4343_16455 [Vibrio breoganii]|uniref:Uncharacterized protein n=1 Tax=Vibrio breoganii TaxID=553239 RepID=A0AAJ5EKY7_9VIBR|nr:hypothetical protein [Vibrio breoganii]NMO73582.1 hypothetical protein [Vibrio breoganii]NMR70716.1 hypothetical protein [Vibrio breoganii]OED93003.1 hypothetical protein A1QE_05830 [Vibrio breoganii ZF-55]OED96885.1 hypothetical protein A1QG_16635 [Vibrio breoganii ZF-29]OEF84753.1 hypothetical protein B003_17265 [Vibrio breoganii 1C10]
MRKFSHIGIPTQTEHSGENFMQDIGLYATDYAKSENQIEWLRFLDDSPMPEELKNTAHVAYEVDDLEEALKGQKVLIEPFSPNESVKIAFILEDEAPVELMQQI